MMVWRKFTKKSPENFLDQLGLVIFLKIILFIALNKFCFRLTIPMLCADKDLKTLEKTAKDELANVSNWLTANELSLNIKNSTYVIFKPCQKKMNYEVNLEMFDFNTNSFVPLERKD